MRKGILVLAILGFAGSLSGLDPFIGTWKMIPEKSTFTSGRSPKYETVVIRQEGYHYRVVIKGAESDGSPISVEYTVLIKGGDGEVIDGPYDAVSSKRVNASTRVTRFKRGKESRTVRAVTTKDGKALTATIRGTEAQG